MVKKFRLFSISMLTMVCALFLVAAPVLAGEPEPDPNISEVTLAINDKNPGMTTDYTATFTLAANIEMGENITFLFADGDGITEDVDFSSSEFTSASLTGMVTYTYLTEPYEMFALTAKAELPAGDYGFSLSDVTNPAESTGLALAATTGELSEESKVTISDVVAIGTPSEGKEDDEDEDKESPHVDDPVMESVAVVLDDPEAGAVATYTVSITVAANQPSGNTFYMYIAGEDSADPAEYDHDFSSAIYASDTVKGVYDGSSGIYASLTYSEDLDIGDHAFTLTDMVNPSAGDYYFAVTTATPGEKQPFTMTETFTIDEKVVAPSKPGKKKLKLKDKKKKSATLKLTEDVTGATYYKLTIEKRKKVWKKYKKLKKRFVVVKRYKNLVTRIKKVKKGKKILLPGRTYRMKWQACNEAGCSDWSKYKNFTMNGEWL